ncbi:MAG: Uma2 family endonuclease [Hyphomicrobiaceae bacterium]|nr:Uma2 family endonuclease [Hyphomicrobiaceae bacterium]
MSHLTTIQIPKQKLTPEEFLAWYEALPKEAGRFELWDGEVIQTRGASGSTNAELSQHWAAKEALFLALRAAFNASGLIGRVHSEGPTVALPNGRRLEPDALVYLGPPVARGELIVPNPIIVCEVLSPSTATHDASTKLQAYFQLDSIHHYVIVDPDKPLIIHHKQGAEGVLETRLISNPAERLMLDPPGLSVDLAEVLAG